jgi:hypothetical protein
MNDVWPSICIIVSNFRPNKAKVYFRFFHVLRKILHLKPITQNDVSSRVNLLKYVKNAFQNQTVWMHANVCKTSPQLWGKYLWYLLHKVSTFYSKLEDEMFRRFLVLYTHTLPCMVCKRDFFNLLYKYKTYKQTKQGFTKYICKLHRLVNLKVKNTKSSNKPVITIHATTTNNTTKIKFTDVKVKKRSSGCGCGA